MKYSSDDILKEIFDKYNRFLSSEPSNQTVFTILALGPQSPQTVSKLSGLSVSTVDRIISHLRVSGLIKKKSKSGRLTFYEVNFDIWLHQNLLYLGLKETPEKLLRKISNILRDKEILSYYLAMRNPDLAYKIMRKIIEKSEMNKKEKDHLKILNEYVRTLDGPGLLFYPAKLLSSSLPFIGKMEFKEDDNEEITKDFLNAANGYFKSVNYLSEIYFDKHSLESIHKKMQTLSGLLTKMMKMELENKYDTSDTS